MSFLPKLKDITTFIFDVDGVLTDGSVLVTEDGHHLRSFNIKDGYALQLAVKRGYNVAIISGGTSEGVRKRLEGLGIKDIFLGAGKKIEVFEKLLVEKGISKEQVLYVGDDIPDFIVMRQVGIAACPNDGVPEIQEVSTYISPLNGGKGVARDVIEKVMKVQGKWMDDQQGFIW
ncbi:KdsC family phosphatase [Solitalea canadensis]|uniref:3-deoxy-D-manno-octulosonate 8-phosphate phosphatase, YrbI family n=1 Tax=Solitalea canadensis (strain ATCC 29591 / DSM 3403 / JCM 21819 / LMG 8368 / NBRC 15130 / NCIMB 12057 / USAM 9D) TaxID=929556 RepID=H8KV14_SOLCM|nr:HAD-IIIA family hydrolase [Solitalea canadensis]AFD06014.1 3-deoxy-D-manno-octulosonate 8-phosphate phosphatase, YrbI family [Solitalea canadensis DSM 3403]